MVVAWMVLRVIMVMGDSFSLSRGHLGHCGWAGEGEGWVGTDRVWKVGSGGGGQCEGWRRKTEGLLVETSLAKATKGGKTRELQRENGGNQCLRVLGPSLETTAADRSIDGVTDG